MQTSSIRPAAPQDAQAICRIYNHYVSHSIATFETTPLTPDVMVTRIADTHDVKLPWLVEEQNGRVIGFAYASRWKDRCAYRYSVESTVYVAADATGQHIGTRLYGKLLEQLRLRSVHTAIGGIALLNPASIALHERFGFVQIAHFREVGFKFVC